MNKCSLITYIKQILTKPTNEAFVDGQNLFVGTTHSGAPWVVDLIRFREYLRVKFGIERAYYFIGQYDKRQEKLFKKIREAGFELVFREHLPGALSHKKGNVDTDIVFLIMRKICEREKIRKIFLVSGDGDYFRMVKYLYDKGKLGRIIFPSRQNASKLYRRIDRSARLYLEDPDVKKKIQKTKGRD